MPGLLADSLPDSYGDQMINTWLIQNGRSLGDINPLDKLCYLGTRAMGALEFHPELNIKEENKKINLENLIELSSLVLQERTDYSSSLKEVSNLLQIGSSAGGARAKAIIALNPETEEIKSGQIEPEKGFEHWIIKLDGVSNQLLNDPQGYTNIEYAYYLIAKEAGITMMPSKLHEENKRCHFLTKRFDRKDNGEKIHMQSFCALAHLDYKQARTSSYETLFKVTNVLKLSITEKEQLFRRMVFNVMGRNCDDHTKNFSFIMDKDGKWQLAPAYDMTFAYNPENFWLKEHNMLINNKSTNINKDDLMLMAKEFSIKNAKQIMEEVKLAFLDFSKYADIAKVDTDKANYIKGQLILDL